MEACWISAQKLGLEDVGSIVIGIDPYPFAPIPKRNRRLRSKQRCLAFNGGLLQFAGFPLPYARR
jgi:hypothetical protein